MSLESLANELLLDIFEYLPAVPLLRSFHGLNARFDKLIFTHFRTYRLDFRAASKQDVDIVCQVNLPLITNRIISIGLSDDDETPQQIQLFRSSGWHLNRFSHLRSLSLDHIRSGEIISEILLESPELIRLSLTGCYFGCKQDDILHLINSIWSLPKLIYCYLNIDLKHGFNIPTPTNFSLSMEHLSIIGVPYRISQLIDLFEHTPRLGYLALDLYCSRDDGQFQKAILSITELNLVVVGPHHGIIENLLQHVPNLCQLKIETCYYETNGYEWEEIIRNYLPKLKVFHLKMRLNAIGGKYKKELFNSFQTQFWLKEHQWFIRYHYNPDDSSNMICLYTLPYSFSYLDILFPILFKSTCPNNDWSYDHVQHLLCRSSSTEGIIMTDLKFPNINYLSIKLPINDHLLLLVRKLDQLRTLKVSRPNDMSDVDAQSQLQALLDHAPHLYSLKFNSWSETKLLHQQPFISKKLTPIVMKTRGIRQVNLLGYDRWFNDEDCIELSHSSLGNHCEVLYIKVKKRTSILYLINTICKLRAFIVRSEDDNWINYSSSSQDQLVQFLQENLPSMCSIKRDSRFVHHIRIWIHL
jgi:hypothetical protein